MSPHGTNLVVLQHNGVLVVGFSRADVIDLEYIKRVADELHGLVETVEPPFVVIDFERVRYLSSSALGVLIAISETIRDRGGDIGISNVSEEILGVFELTKFFNVIPLFDSTAEAIRKITK